MESIRYQSRWYRAGCVSTFSFPSSFLGNNNLVMRDGCWWMYCWNGVIIRRKSNDGEKDIEQQVQKSIKEGVEGKKAVVYRVASY